MKMMIVFDQIVSFDGRNYNWQVVNFQQELFKMINFGEKN